MKSREEVLHALAAALPRLQQRFPIGRVEVFGSYSRGDQTPESDLDLAIEFRETMSYRDHVALQEALSAATGLRVDIADRASLKPRVRQRVEREAIAV